MSNKEENDNKIDEIEEYIAKQSAIELSKLENPYINNKKYTIRIESEDGVEVLNDEFIIVSYINNNSDSNLNIITYIPSNNIVDTIIRLHKNLDNPDNKEGNY